MSSDEIRKQFLEFFKSKGHAIVPSSSLVPTDPSVLLTTAGMQQFKPYFTGELDARKDFGASTVASIQKCFRTSDIEEVGDKTHLTLFEMLGHFSFGDYFKKETIEWTYQLLTEIFRFAPERISATVFEGDSVIPFDQESFEAWSRFLPKRQIRKGSRKDNVWGPAGSEGPCGAANEVYADDVEVATLVFMEYYCYADGTLKSLPKKGVDVGWGFERVLLKTNPSAPDIFHTDIFEGMIKGITEIAPTLQEREVRIFADHLRSSIFLVADGVRPSNKEAGYILRRLLRRILAHRILYDVHADLFTIAHGAIKEKFGALYPEVNNPRIIEVMEAEQQKFEKAIGRGITEIKKFPKITAKEAFYLYESFGLPFELIRELAPETSKNLDRHDFDQEFKTHQEISRAGKEAKFGGHGLYLKTGEVTVRDVSELEKVTRLHTATHLMHAGLRAVLGDEVQQKGSDITVERTRFDFNFPRKVTAEELAKVEAWVNEVIKKDAKVEWKETTYEEAVKDGALGFFRQKYPPRVKVYTMQDPHSGEIYSKELCGGPHVTHTGEIVQFKIVKEETVGAGVRRIRGVVIP